MTDTVTFYSNNAARLVAQYDGLTFEQVHSSWLGLLESRSPGGALDIGAGSGRDAVALNARGWCVTAVEPAKGLRMVGRAKNTAIQWLDDRLPALARLDDKQQFDLILLSAVWMHLPAPDRPEAFTRLKQLLKPDGMVVISLRHGPSERTRPMYPVSVEELKELAARKGLSVRLQEAKSQDCLQRDQIHWQTVVVTHRK